MSAATLPGRGRGRPGGCDPDLVARMYQLHYGQGLSYERISALLNAAGVPLPAGGTRWLRSSVERVMHTNYGEAIGKELGWSAQPSPPG